MVNSVDSCAMPPLSSCSVGHFFNVCIECFFLFTQEEYDELLKYAVIVPSYPTISSLGLGRSLAGGDYHKASAQPSVPLAAEATGRQTSQVDQNTTNLVIDNSASSQKSELECKQSSTSVKHKATAVVDLVDAKLPSSGGMCTLHNGAKV